MLSLSYMYQWFGTYVLTVHTTVLSLHVFVVRAASPLSSVIVIVLFVLSSQSIIYSVVYEACCVNRQLQETQL